MTTFDDNVRELNEIFGNPIQRRGNTGRLDDNGQVHPNPTIGLDSGYVWVRLKGERAAIAVININVRTDRANIPVILEESSTGILQVKEVDAEDAVYTYGGSLAADMNRPDKVAELEKGPILHRRIKDLRLRLSTSGGLVLYLDKGVYQKVNGDLVAWNGGTIDVTASLPGSADTKRIVLVGITTSTNLITQSAATAVATSVTPTEEPYFSLSDFATARNAAASSVLWLWGFGLLNGETEITNTDRFVDLRAIAYEEPTVYTVTASSPLASSGGNNPNISLTGIVPIANGGTGASTAITAFNALSPLTTKGDILGNNGTDDVRLAVGTNGQVLIADSTAASGLAWSSVPATLEATLTTTDATITDLVTYAVAELVGVTIRGRFVAAKNDRTAAAGGFFRVTYRRATGGNVTMVGSGYLEEEHDSGTGSPVLLFDADTGSQSGRVRWQGVAGEQWNIKVNYEVVTI